MLGLGLGLTHQRYSNTYRQLPAGYMRLTSRVRGGKFITLRGRRRTFGITDLIGRVA